MRLNLAIACVLLASTALPQLAHAGMGNRGSMPVYHPEPCQGDACKADDPRSGAASSCQGLLCGFSSAKAMQPPVTAAQAAEAQQKAAAEAIKPLETTTPVAKTATAKKRRARHVAESDRSTQSPGASTQTPSPTAK